MSELPRIPTPWKQQWRRIRYQLVPVLSVAVCATLTGWLWNRQMGAANLVGEAHVQVRNIVSPVAGMLVAVPSREKPWSTHDPVEEAKDVVAQLDTAPANTALALLNQELARFKQELAARQEELRQAEQQRQKARDAEARRLAAEVDELKLKVLDRKGQVETDRTELQHQNALYEHLKELANRSAVGPSELLQAQMRRDVIAQRLKGNEAALAQAEAQCYAASRRLEELAKPQPASTDTILAPLQTRITEQEQKIKDLEAQIKAMSLVAPITGRISSILRHPGEAVQPNDVIMTITDDQSKHIVSYVRQSQRLKPEPGMAVRIRSRNDTGQMIVAVSEVESVGPSYAPIPVHHSRERDPEAADWGLPVKIRMPLDLRYLRPGELVEVTLLPKGNSHSGTSGFGF